MVQKISKIVNFINNMGVRYLFFRIFYTVKIKLGWLKKRFPVNPDFKTTTTLEEWRNNLPSFFFYGKSIRLRLVLDLEQVLGGIEII